jgi:oligopeptide transport system substrate-binding protein
MKMALILACLIFGVMMNFVEAFAKPLRIGFPAVVPVLDPHQIEDAYSMFVVLQIHRGLLRYLPDGSLKPDIASSWTISTDEKIFRFILADSKFSNGSSVSSENVVHSIARLFFVESAMGADMEYIEGVRKFRESKKIEDLGVRAIDNKTIEIRLKTKTDLLLKHLAAVDCAILNITDFRQSPLNWQQIGTSGPYRLKESSDNAILIEKWRADPFESKSPPQQVLFGFSSQPIDEQALADKLDVLDRIDMKPDDVKKFEAMGWRRTVTELVMERFVIMNPTKHDLNLRNWLFDQVNPSDLVREMGFSGLTPAFGLIPNGIPGAILSPTNKVSGSLPPKNAGVKLQYSANDLMAEKIASYLKRVWAPVKVEFEPMSRPQLLKTMFASEGSILIGSKALDYFDGYSVLTYFRSGYSGNYFHVANKAIDASLDAVVSITDDDLRIREYQNIQREIIAERTVVPLVFGSLAAGLWGKNVAFVPPHPAGQHTLSLEMIVMK